MFEDFEGAALTLRFDDGAVEVELAGDAAITEQGVSMSDGGDDVLATLPEDTAVAIGVGLSEGWFCEYLDQIQRFMGTEGDVDDFLELAESETGLSFPEDIETLLGESTAIVDRARHRPGGVREQRHPGGAADRREDQGRPGGHRGRPRQDPGPDGQTRATSWSPRARVTRSRSVRTRGTSPTSSRTATWATPRSFQNVVREAENATSVVSTSTSTPATAGW